jgi:hypothetical protein
MLKSAQRTRVERFDLARLYVVKNIVPARRPEYSPRAHPREPAELLNAETVTFYEIFVHVRSPLAPVVAARRDAHAFGDERVGFGFGFIFFIVSFGFGKATSQRQIRRGAAQVFPD